MPNIFPPLLVSLYKNAQQKPDKIAFNCDEKSLTWQELLSQTTAMASYLETLPQTIGLMANNSLNWAIIDIAMIMAGKTFVPLPTFFSESQCTHIIKMANIEHIMTESDMLERVKNLAPCSLISAAISPSLKTTNYKPTKHQSAKRLIFTSGSTGTPKGVIHGIDQLSHSMIAIAKASKATDTDRQLSTLPYALLLEQICSIHIPIYIGATAIIAPKAANALLAGNITPCIEAIYSNEPTSMVLVPDQLSGLVDYFRTTKKTAPKSLRFIAVGGAAISDNILQYARACGLPIYQGYGLSECCAVVALTKEKHPKNENCGKPLEGIKISLSDKDEITVTAPTVMQGYLDEAPLSRDNNNCATWKTGDIGKLDKNGNLTILGRKDNLIITPNGRNINPEWIEQQLTIHPHISMATLLPYKNKLALILSHTAKDICQILQNQLKNIPSYAQPNFFIEISRKDLQKQGLITENARPKRTKMAHHISNLKDTEIMTNITELKTPAFYDILIAETQKERDAFLATPILQQVQKEGLDREIYKAYLEQAFHHVKYTCPLLGLSVGNASPDDTIFRDAMFEYIEEEKGHEEWILNDIEALGGNREASRNSKPNLSCQLMIAYMHYAIEHIHPYAMLGSVHVLEGMAVALADMVAAKIGERLDIKDGKGFSYLTSHGAIDIEHVAFFKELANNITNKEAQTAIIETSKIVYRLFGDMFTEIATTHKETQNAA